MSSGIFLCPYLAFRRFNFLPSSSLPHLFCISFVYSHIWRIYTKVFFPFLSLFLPYPGLHLSFTDSSQKLFRETGAKGRKKTELRLAMQLGESTAPEIFHMDHCDNVHGESSRRKNFMKTYAAFLSHLCTLFSIYILISLFFFLSLYAFLLSGIFPFYSLSNFIHPTVRMYSDNLFRHIFMHACMYACEGKPGTPCIMHEKWWARKRKVWGREQTSCRLRGPDSNFSSLDCHNPSLSSYMYMRTFFFPTFNSFPLFVYRVAKYSSDSKITYSIILQEKSRKQPMAARLHV